jgi:hypothetical protein
MNSKQIFMIVTIVAALSAAMIATPAMAQNMSGGNMTGGNMTGGNMTGKILVRAQSLPTFYFNFY